MQRFSLPDKNIFLTHVPQDIETSLEAMFRSKSRPAFYLPQKTIFMHRKVITHKILF